MYIGDPTFRTDPNFSCIDGSACLPGFRPKNCCEEDDMSVVIGEHNLHDDNRNDPIRYKLNLSELFTLFFKESSGD